LVITLRRYTFVKNDTMAKPIKETPLLKGNDAKKFMSNMKSSASNRFTLSKRDKILTNYYKIRAITKV